MPEAPPLPSVHVVTHARGFDQLEKPWTELQSGNPDSSIFLSWDWQRLWWKHYGVGRELCILVATRGPDVVGILPLYLETHRKAGGLFIARKLRQIGVGGDTAPDDLGGLFLADEETQAAASMVRMLARRIPRWDMLDWSDLAPRSTLATLLARHLSEAGLRVALSCSDPIIYGTLPASWDAYRRGLSCSRRETMTRKRRKFEALPGARMRVIDTPDAVGPAFEQLARLHRLRWATRTERPAFTSPQYVGFHRDLMTALLPKGRLRLLSLDLGEQPIAMLYGMQYKRRFCFFQGGFDPGHAQSSPGDVLMGYAVELAINQGCEIFDMLKGDHDYKRHFFRQERRNLGIRAFRPGLVDLAYRMHGVFRPPTSPPLRDIGGPCPDDVAPADNDEGATQRAARS